MKIRITKPHTDPYWWYNDKVGQGVEVVNWHWYGDCQNHKVEIESLSDIRKCIVEHGHIYNTVIHPEVVWQAQLHIENSNLAYLLERDEPNIEDLVDEIMFVSANKEGKSPLELLGKLMEESGEVAEALLSYGKACGCEYKGKTIEDVAEESVDVLLVILAFMTKIGMTKQDMARHIKSKLAKWQEVIG